MNSSIAEYIIEKIDQAIENEWIKVYYQPVIRTLTGQLCGVESLARWDDPYMGQILPNDFIGILEDNALIHKLDCHIVNLVCRDISNRMKNNEPVVPASVNFSRQDFMSCDMLKYVEETVKKYDIPRDLIHIEITESMIASDEELMKRVIDEFKARGYEIWMDDFGSQYSSLNILKDYSFDVLKLDMKFLSSFTDKSKAIVRATINMAKDINVGTLAEGVETKEHIDFLKSVGCARLQGYYFSPPLPIDDLFDVLDQKNISMEDRKWRHYYNVASHEVRATRMSQGLIEYDGNTFKTLFMNNVYRDQILVGNTGLEEVDQMFFEKDGQIYKLFQGFIEVLNATQREEVFYYTNRGNYYSLRAEEVCEAYGKHLYRTSINNISADENKNDKEHIDNRIRELNRLYEDVLIINLAKDFVKPLLGGFYYGPTKDPSGLSYMAAIDGFCKNLIIPTERQSFVEFMNPSTLKKRLKESANETIEKLFRVKQKDGAYEWKSFSLLYLGVSDENEVFLLVKDIPQEIHDILNHQALELGRNIVKDTSFEINDYANLFENAVWDSSIKFFWKDKERRFLGVSQAFLEFYKIEKLEDIVGKTDEDMHWHVDNDPYRNDEWDVIRTGKHIKNVQGQCIVNGVVHNITCSKMPIYDNGEIVGLIGYFLDMDDPISEPGEYSIIDEVTGLMNPKSFVDTMFDYSIQYEDKGTKYGLILFENINQVRIDETYGKRFGEKLLKEIGKRIVSITGQTCAVGRMKRSVFGIMTYIDSKEELEALASKVIETIDSINSVGGNTVTLKLKYACKMCNDEGVSADNLYAKVLGGLSS